MRMRSMPQPLFCCRALSTSRGSDTERSNRPYGYRGRLTACPLPVTRGLDHFSSNQACSATVLIAGNSGGIVRLALAFLPQRAASGLSLAPLEVFPQRRPQTLFLALPVRVFWLVIHGANVGCTSKLRQGEFR